METILILVAIFLSTGFAAGAVLGTTVVSEARRLEQRVEEKRAKLEADAKASFDEFSKDVENIVTRLEAIEHNIDVKIASTILPAGKS